MSNLAVSDRVCALSVEESFATKATFLSPLVVKVPNDLSFEEAATMPTCIAIAVHSLIDIGRLERDPIKGIIHLAMVLREYIPFSILFILTEAC